MIQLLTIYTLLPPITYLAAESSEMAVSIHSIRALSSDQTYHQTLGRSPVFAIHTAMEFSTPNLPSMASQL